MLLLLDDGRFISLRAVSPQKHRAHSCPCPVCSSGLCPGGRRRACSGIVLPPMQSCPLSLCPQPDLFLQIQMRHSSVDYLGACVAYGAVVPALSPVSAVGERPWIPVVTFSSFLQAACRQRGPLEGAAAGHADHAAERVHLSGARRLLRGNCPGRLLPLIPTFRSLRIVCWTQRRCRDLLDK